MRNLTLAILVLGLMLTHKITYAQPKLGTDPVRKVVAAMTIEEKVNFVIGMGKRITKASATEPNEQIYGETQLLVPGAAGTTYPIPRLGIPAMVLADGPAGLRISPNRDNDQATYFCTAFPVATLLASTWDKDLVYNVGQAMGNEALEYGTDVLLAPGMNIQRNPLCGRNFEYYSEDPFLTGKIAASMVNGVQSQSVGTSIKHFAANNSETNRFTINTLVSQRALREIYLEGFRIAVEEAHPWTVMSSYNLINGEYTSESYDLLTKILRQDWKFTGYVMTDWSAGKDAVLQMKAGNDLIMPGKTPQFNELMSAIQNKKIDIKILDKNIERILNIMLRCPRFKKYEYSNKPDLPSHAKITREAANEGMILLKNTNNTLPFGKEIKHIAAFGNSSYDIFAGGTGSGDVNEAYSVSLADGMHNAGFILNQDANKLYANYMNLSKAGRPKLAWHVMPEPIEELRINKFIISKLEEESDAAIITIGRISGENKDRTNTKGDFLLSDTELQLIQDVTTAFHAKGKKVIVILNIGGVIETAGWRDIPDAILLAWQAGQETGNSIADVLCGKVNPSGKLAVTFPVKYEDVPSSSTFPGKIIKKESVYRGINSEITYNEGIYVGYRFYETFGVKPSYDFGYGLSFTSFEYSNLKLSSPEFKNTMTITVDIKNTGKFPGKEVVQLYMKAPALKLDKPIAELKGFAKTQLLQPGESQALTFQINSRNLASFDSSISAWIAESGDYLVKIGASSRDIKLTASFMLPKELLVKKESLALVPAVNIDELKPSKN